MRPLDGLIIHGYTSGGINKSRPADFVADEIGTCAEKASDIATDACGASDAAAYA